MRGKKTGGRVKGVSFNKPKDPTSATTPITTPVAAPPPAAPPAGGNLDASRARARTRGKPKRPALASLALTVETWPIARLVEYDRNPRKNDAQVGRMADAIKEFGFRIPIVAKSDGTIVDGHLRFKAARRLKLPTVPVALADDLTDSQIRAFRLLANKSAEWASWDDDLLRIELDDLRSDGFDLDMTGFDADEISVLFDEPEPPPPPPERHTTKSVVCPACQHEFAP
jgi:hypothetical protein